jgi:hypothetical protein
VAAATYPAEVEFLVLNSSCGVSPAKQMRIGCDKQLTLNGFGDGDRLRRDRRLDANRGQRRRVERFQSLLRSAPFPAADPVDA